MLKFLDHFHNYIVIFILIIISLLCMIYTISGIGMNMSAWKMTLINLNITHFSDSIQMKSLDAKNFNFSHSVFLFLMWFFMMIAMMLPSTIPTIIMFDKISQERKKYKYKYVATINFVFTYFIVWGIFSLLATIVHLYLEIYEILNISTLSVNNSIGALLFILAGIYQMTPFKNSCLRYCRNPIELFINNKIFNYSGSFYIGIKHGIFCVGCCWPLMFLLFYSGIMNILWIIGLSFYVFVEKYIAKGKKLNSLTGFILILIGLKILYF